MSLTINLHLNAAKGEVARFYCSSMSDISWIQLSDNEGAVVSVFMEPEQAQQLVLAAAKLAAWPDAKAYTAEAPTAPDLPAEPLTIYDDDAPDAPDGAGESVEASRG